MQEVVGLGVEEEDRKRTWMGDAEEAAKRGSIETARSIYGALIAAFPGGCALEPLQEGLVALVPLCALLASSSVLTC